MEMLNMSSLNLPPGFRFHPTDQELIIHYLEKKVSSHSNPSVSIIADIDLYKFNPWELPARASFGETEWFFFTPRSRKYPNKTRPNRAAGSGYWKAAGTDKPILDSLGSQCIGVKKALVFYKGRSPKSVKTNWVMHEYRLLDDACPFKRLRNTMQLDDWVLCRVRQKGNTPLQTGDNQRSIFNSSPPVTLQYSEKKNSHSFNKSSNVFQTTFMAPVESAIDNMKYLSFHGGPTVSDTNSYSHTAMNSHLKDALASIKRTLSIDALEGEVLLPPNEMLNLSSADIMDNTKTFQIPSANSVSVPQCFPGAIH